MGTELSAPILQQSIERVAHNGTTRRVSIRLKDGTRSEYALPEPNRPGVSGRRVEATGRVRRLSGLMALAIKMEELLRNRSVSSYREITKLGQISLAAGAGNPGGDSISHEDLGGNRSGHRNGYPGVSQLVDWDMQLKQFRALMDSTRNC